MKPRFSRLSFALTLAALVTGAGVTSLSAQSSDAMAIAGLREDIRILDERTRALTVEMDQMRRDNAALRDLVQKQTSSQYVTLAQFNTAISELERALRSGDKDLAVQLTQQMERLAKQTQSALDALAKSASTRTPAPQMQFTPLPTDVKGVVYVVQPGDTLSSIATKHGAQIRDIQNANQIADPRTLQAGQSLFIPQR
ncbi:LysM peptidoglycan-binding domain-containing protein [Congregicoccus parvus]|uniref:LysM peptidoglycan-binding domain-containing protein n=1 Tax=Congregicoccus parvus TaxID=3081749 RepID=UPI003FA5A9A6